MFTAGGGILALHGQFGDPMGQGEDLCVCPAPLILGKGLMVGGRHQGNPVRAQGPSVRAEQGLRDAGAADRGG